MVTRCLCILLGGGCFRPCHTSCCAQPLSKRGRRRSLLGIATFVQASSSFFRLFCLGCAFAMHLLLFLFLMLATPDVVVCDRVRDLCPIHAASLRMSRTMPPVGAPDFNVFLLFRPSMAYSSGLCRHAIHRVTPSPCLSAVVAAPWASRHSFKPPPDFYFSNFCLGCAFALHLLFLFLMLATPDVVVCDRVCVTVCV